MAVSIRLIERRVWEKTFSSSINAVALQPDGKVLIGGLFAGFNGKNCNRVARLNGRRPFLPTVQALSFAALFFRDALAVSYHLANSVKPIANETPADFWNALAPFHSAIENNYFDLPSLHRILGELREPVLIVGAGQGLIVAELLKQGLHCDGVDFSAEMIRYAKLRRGLSLIQADAKAMPLKDAAYETIIYATGVVDFISDEAEIKRIMAEAARIVSPTGSTFVAFYRASAAVENLLTEVGLLHNHVLLQRQTLEINGLDSFQMLRWVAKRARVGYLRAGLLLIRLALFSTLREKMNGVKMKKIFRQVNNATSLIESAPEKVPYRNEAEIRNLFRHLGIPLKQLTALRSCIIARI